MLIFKIQSPVVNNSKYNYRYKHRIDANIKWNLIHRKMVKEQKRMVYDLRHPQLRPRGESSKLAQWPESPNFVLFLFLS